MPSPRPLELRARKHLAPRDIRTSVSIDMKLPFVVFADCHPMIADAMSRLLGDSCRVSAPIYDLELLQAAVGVLEYVVLVTGLSFGTVSALSTIRKLVASQRHLYVIAYSGHCDSLTRENARLSGAHEFVGRLETSSALLAAITRGWQTLCYDPSIPRIKERTQSRTKSAHLIKNHDHGPVISWCLRSQFAQRRIAEVIGVGITTVEYHSRHLND